MGSPPRHTIRNLFLATALLSICLVWMFGGCAATSSKGGSGDDDSSSSTTSSSSGGGVTAGSGGVAAGGGGVTGGAGGTGGQLVGGGGGGAVGGGGGVTGGAGGSGPCGYGSPVCIIAQWDFDSGCPSGWTTSGNNSDWSCGMPTSGPADDCEAGGNLWATGLHGNAATCQSSTLQSPAVDLSAYQGQTVLLGFYHWYDFRECAAAAPFCNIFTNAISYSGGRIEVDSGSGWSVATPDGGYESGQKTIDCSSSSGGAPPCNGASCALDEETDAYTCGGIEQQWHQGLVNISSHTTASFQARFVYGSNDADPFIYVNREGWYIDNVAILIPGPCP